MLEIKGKHCKDCKIFAETIEEEALSTVYGICDHPAFKDSKIRIMPDCHQGKGIVIGFTCPVGEYVNPAHVGCVDCDTEILTKRGWIKISDYNFSFGEILQFDPITETASFIKPIKYIKQKQDKFYWFKNSKGLNQMVSSDHNMLVYYGQSYRNSTNLKYIKVKPNFFDDKKSLEKGYYRFKAAFDKDDETDLNIPDDWIRIDIMVQADGYIHINKNGTVRAHLHLKKHRKIERAKLLLNNVNVEFKEHYNNKNDSYTISFNVPLYIGKDLHKYFSANRHQLEIIAEECLYWDGHRGYRSFYSSTDKNSIDLIQYAFTATNTRSSISKIKMYNKNYSQGYTVIPTKNNYVGYTCKPIIVNSKDGFEYCFSTTTGCFVCRREGHVFITGNCDVGCSMTTIQLSKQIEEKDYPTFERQLRNKIPTGFEIQSKVVYPEKDLYKFLEKEYRKARSSWPEMIPAIDRVDERFITKLCQRVGIEERLFYKSIGTIGGGEGFDCLRSG